MYEKYVPFYVKIKPYQKKFLKDRSQKTGDQDMSQFIRDALDVAIKKEKAREEIEEIMDYT